MKKIRIKNFLKPETYNDEFSHEDDYLYNHPENGPYRRNFAKKDFDNDPDFPDNDIFKNF